MAKASWAPSAPLTTDSPEQLARLVRGSLGAQAKLGASAYLVPGLMPDDKQDDLRHAYETIVTAAGEFDDIPAKPLVLFVGAHSEGLTAARALLDSLPSFLSALHLQVGPTAPITDGPTKLQRVTELYLYARDLGLPVMAGHAGAITPALRACGIDAADAGLASAETFQPSGAQHGLRARIAEAKRIAGLPQSMRLTEMIHLVISRRSTVTAVNAALTPAGIAPLDTRSVDHHLNWLGPLAESHSAA